MNTLETLHQCVDVTDQEGYLDDSAPALHAALTADARALWAVRALDAYDPTWGNGFLSGKPAVIVLGLDNKPPRWFKGTTREAARLAAAEAVYPELPESVRKYLGERP